MNQKSDADVSIAGSSKASTISSTEEKSSSDNTFIILAAKKGRRQTFRQAWLEDPELKLWLQQADNPLTVKCTVCSKMLKAKKSHLEKHAKTDIHIMNIQQKAGASISVPTNKAISNSDAENDSSSDSTFVVPAAKKIKRQAFREAWLEKPYFKPWLQQADDPLKVKCLVCSKLLSLGKSHLEKHAKTDIHITNIQQKTGASISVPSNAAISSSDTENNSSTDGRRTRAPAEIPECAKRLNRNPLKQAFRKAWLKDPQFHLWLQETEDPHKAKCAVCYKFLRARKSHLQQHANTATHITNLKRKKGASISAPSNAVTTSIVTSFAKPSNAATTSIMTSFAKPSNAATTSIVTSYAKPSNAAISSPDAENNSSADVCIAGPSSAAAIIIRPVTKNNSISDSTFIVPTARKPKATNTLHREQAFRKAWLKDPQFQLWLQETEDPHKAKCTLCSKFIRARKCDLQQHAITDFHIMNIQQKTGASISGCSNAATRSIDTSFARPGNASISSSIAVNDSIIVPVANKVRKQTSCQTWLSGPCFKPWLQQADDPHKAKGTVCLKYVIVGQSGLQNHANSKVNITNMVHQKEAITSTVKRTFADNVKVAEMTICIDAIEHGRSFQSYRHFIRMLEMALLDPNLLSHMSLGRTKMTAIVKNVKNKSIITERLQGKFFSVLIDETTDISDMKIVCFLIRYVYNYQIYIYLLDLVKLSVARAENIYTCFLYSLKKYNLSLRNMVGVCVVQCQCHGGSKELIDFPFVSYVNIKFNSNNSVQITNSILCVGKKQCQMEEVPSTSSVSETASTRTRRNGETPTTTHRIHPIVHDHRYARIPWSMWKKILVQKKQIQSLKRERHIDKQQIFRLKKQVTSLKRIVNKLRRTRALPDTELESLEAIADKNKV